MAGDVIDFCNKRQIDYSQLPGGMYVEKVEAYVRGLRMFPVGVGVIVEIGHESLFGGVAAAEGFTVEGVNLPEDMHAWAGKEVNAVLCRHVLEHSPIPLLVILNVFESLKAGGYFLAVVPKAETEYILKMETHITVLPREAWEHLFEMAGFEAVKYEEDMFNGQHYEMRFLLRRNK